MADRVKLTNAFVAKLRCPADKKEIELTDVGGLLSVWISKANKPIFRYRYSFGGKVKRIKLGPYADDFGVEEAKVAARLYDQMRANGHDPENYETAEKLNNTSTTVGMVLDYHLSKLTKEDTRYSVGKLFKDLRAMHGADTLEAFTPAVAKEFIEANYEHRQGSARNLVRNAVAAFNKALSPHSDLYRPLGYQNPFRGVRKAIKWWGSQPVENHAKAFEEKQWKALFAAITKAYKTDTNPNGIHIIELLLCTGARPSEIGSLKLSEIKVINGQPYIDKTDHKLRYKGKDRRIWLMPAALKVIEAAKAENERYRYKGPYLFPQRRKRTDQKTPYIAKVNGYMEVVSGLAGFRVTPYSLRGAYISFALDTLGIDWLEHVAANVGHSDPTVTLRHYRKHRPTKLIDAAKRVERAMKGLKAA
jgi:integrase